MRNYSEEELQVLGDVLPNVALQLRGTMANLYMAVERLAPPDERETDGDKDRCAAVFYKNYYQMYRMVSNLTEAGKLFEHRRFALYDDDIVGLARLVCREVEFLFEQRGVQIEFISDRDSRIIGMDAAAIRKLLMNLLSNALKYTPSGGSVTVRVKTEGAFIKLSVADTGRGMSSERLAQIFTGYLKTDSYDPMPSGLGLGLPICQCIAQGHGGMIVAESEEGKGSVFTLSLPALKAGRVRLNDHGSDYSGGFNSTLVELADALAPEAFLQRYLD